VHQLSQGEDEDFCCCRRYVAGRDILPEEICYWRGYVTGGDMLLEGILKGGI